METVVHSTLLAAHWAHIGTDKSVLVSQCNVLPALFGTDLTALLHQAVLKALIL